MIPSRSRPQSRRRPLFHIEAESLEGRQLLTGGAGNTIALTKATIATAGGTTSTSFVLESGHFTFPKGRATLGVDTVAASGGSVQPVITAVAPTSPGPKGPSFHQKATVKNSSHAVLATVVLPKKGAGATHYDVQVTAQNKTSGDLLIGYYLPGDANGDGKVDKTDIAAIKSIMGKAVDSSAYNFDADSNRDGKITAADINIARKNLGVSTTISPTFTANLDPATDTGAADRITNAATVNFTGTGSPGATITFHEVNAKTADASTTADSAGKYSVSIPLALGTNTFQVTSVDAFGQKIQGSIQPVTYTTDAVPAATKTA